MPLKPKQQDLFRQEARDMAPQLKGRAELAKAVEPIEGASYKITAVEEVKTAVQGFSGLRVSLEPEKRKEGDANEYATMVWMREQAGRKSKLGSLLAAFGEFLGDEDEALNTDNWIGHVIRVISWTQRNREVRVMS